MAEPTVPQMFPVQSSNLESAGYTPEGGVRVRFKNGYTYDHPGTTEYDLQQLLAADSAGKWYNANLKGKHERVL